MGNLKSVKGKFGMAFGKFSQSDFVLVASPMKKAKLPVKDIMVEAWVIDEGLLEWGGYVGCFQDNGSFEKGWVLGTNNAITFAVSTEKPNDGDGILTYVVANAKYNKGKWIHVAGTYEGKKIKIYINGELAGDNSSHTGDINYPEEGDSAPDAEFIIGKYKDINKNFPHQGSIDEVKLYERALSAAKNKKNMNSHGLAVNQADKLGMMWGTIKRNRTR